MSVLAQEREQGRAEGKAEAKAVPEPYHAQVLAADANQLDAWIDAVLDAESIDAVFGRPTAH